MKNLKSILLFLSLMLVSIFSNSQEVLIEEIVWSYNDSIDNVVFQNKEQILDWSLKQLSFSSANSKDLLINDCKINIILVEGCSGLACWKIYIFKEINDQWFMILKTDFLLRQEINIVINEEKVVFTTKAETLSEILFQRFGCF